jgi:hypothetical protein
MDTLKPGCKVYYRHPRCACVGGGFTENYGTIMGSINAPNGLFYKVTTDYQGTFVVPANQILRVIEG